MGMSPTAGSLSPGFLRQLSSHYRLTGTSKTNTAAREALKSPIHPERKWKICSLLSGDFGFTFFWGRTPCSTQDTWLRWEMEKSYCGFFFFFAFFAHNLSAVMSHFFKSTFQPSKDRYTPTIILAFSFRATQAPLRVPVSKK